MTSQVLTSVTVISSCLKGVQAVSLSGLLTLSAPSVMAGSAWEQAGSFFLVSSDETPTATSWTALATGSTVYIYATPSGSAGSQTIALNYTDSAPVWSDSKCAYYASTGSNVRALAKLYKQAATEYAAKGVLHPVSHIGTFGINTASPGRTLEIVDRANAGLRIYESGGAYYDLLIEAGSATLSLTSSSGQTVMTVVGATGGVTFANGVNVSDGLTVGDGLLTAGSGLTVLTGGITTDGTALKTKVVNIGEWNMDATPSVNVAHGLTISTIRSVDVTITDDSGTGHAPLDIEMNVAGLGVQDGRFYWGSTNIILGRTASGKFDATAYSATVSTVSTRGWITIVYAA